MSAVGAFGRRCLYGAALYPLIGILGLMSLVLNFGALLLYPVLSEARGRKFGRVAIARCYRIFWYIAGLTGLLRVDATCLDPLRSEGGLIIIANHPSMLDALLLVARLPRSACIMKANLMENIFLGSGARLARYICNDSPCGLVRLAVQDLRRGGQLILFPEGTRTVASPINPFRPGLTLIAKLADAPIQTVFIETGSPYLGKNWSIWRIPPAPVTFTLRLGKRFEPTQDRDRQLEDIENYYRASMSAGPSTATTEACPASHAPTSF